MCESTYKCFSVYEMLLMPIMKQNNTMGQTIHFIFL